MTTILPSLRSRQALEGAKSADLLFWAARYNLFVMWSVDRSHPWDALPGAANHATLEVGKQRGSDSEVRLLAACPMQAGPARTLAHAQPLQMHASVAACAHNPPCSHSAAATSLAWLRS